MLLVAELVLPVRACPTISSRLNTARSGRDDQPLRSFYPGDSRAAIAPFLAYRAFQRRGIAFRWLFNLDDDTIVFPHAVLRLGARLDADMPYFLSGAATCSPASSSTAPEYVLSTCVYIYISVY